MAKRDNGTKRTNGGTTTTNASGVYGVSNLPLGSYRVTVTTASGPINTFGLTNTVDPNGGNDSTATLSTQWKVAGVVA